MNFVACPECRNELHKRTYRKKGGGFHALCKTCRTRQRTQTWRERQKLKQIKHLTEEDKLNEYKASTAKALISEYKNATRLNRNRIKALEENKKPTRTTILWLNKRRAIQQVWVDALNALITQLHQNKKVPTLREYMSGNGYREHANNYSRL